MIGATELETRLTAYPTVNHYLGQQYRQLANLGELAELLTPACWSKTESGLAQIAAQVEGLSDHWSQNPVGRTKAHVEDLIYSSLAEIEGFQHLLNQPFDRVCALPYSPRRGGKAPDACCWSGDEPHLFEIKSLWAHLEHRTEKLRQVADHYYFERDQPQGGHNRRVVRKALSRLLGTAAVQLRDYAIRPRYADCPKTVLLVVTQREPVFAVRRTPNDIADEWLRKHRGSISSVEWVPPAAEGAPWR